MKKKLLLVNGPNLRLLGLRQPEIYGTRTLSDIEITLREILIPHAIELETLQSNHEGIIVDFLNHSFINLKNGIISCAGIIINPGALTHTSVSLRDALEVFCSERVPIFEVHLSNVYARENFRKKSLVRGIASGVVCGFGAFGYVAAAQKIIQLDSPSITC